MTTTITSRRRLRHVAGAAALVAASIAAITFSATPASAHGSAENPLSRIYGCYLDNPENPSKQGCKNIKAENNASAMYNWNQLVIGDARNGLGAAFQPQYREIMEDGSICSAGDPNFSGIDSATDDWPITQVKSGQEYEFNFKATQVHNPYEFTYYVTKDSYDATQPLTWDQVEEVPFLVASAVRADGGNDTGDGWLDPEGNAPTDTADIEPYGQGNFHFKALLPEKRGHHIVLSTWQGMVKADGSIQSNEAFVACSDVNFS